MSDHGNAASQVGGQKPIEEGLRPLQNLTQILAAGVTMRAGVGQEALKGFGLRLGNLDPTPVLPGPHVDLRQLGPDLDANVMTSRNQLCRLTGAAKVTAVDGAKLRGCQKFR